MAWLRIVFLALMVPCLAWGQANEGLFKDISKMSDEEAAKYSIGVSYGFICGIGFAAKKNEQGKRYIENGDVLAKYCACIIADYTGGMSHDRLVQYGKFMKELEVLKKQGEEDTAKKKAIEAKWGTVFKDEDKVFRAVEKSCQKKLSISVPSIYELGDHDGD